MPDWTHFLQEAVERLGPPVRAQDFIKKFATASNPVLLSCDGGDYVVKSKDAGRMIITDQIAGGVGHAAEAPVAEIVLVDVPADLIAAEPQMAHMSPGIAHGSRWIPNCSEQRGFEYTNVPENRDRFSRIALFYGWVVASDHQFIYENDEPHLVHSVDHGGFFPGSTGWTSETLRNAPAPAPDDNVVNTCRLTPGEVDAARLGMTRVSDQIVSEATAAVPRDWGFADEERVTVAEFLATRRDVVWWVAPEGTEQPGKEAEV